MSTLSKDAFNTLPEFDRRPASLQEIIKTIDNELIDIKSRLESLEKGGKGK